MHKLRNAFFHPPLGDFDRVQKSVFLNFSLLIAAVASPILAVINLRLGATDTAIALVFLSAFSLIGLVLVYRKRSLLVSLLFGFLILLIPFYALYDGFSLFDAAILLLPSLITFFGYLYGKKAIPIVTLILIAGVATLAAFESAGLTHPPMPTTLSRVISISIFLSLAAGLNWVISNNWDALVSRIRESNLVLQQVAEECGLAEREVHLLNEQLEGRVRERTAELETANSTLQSFGYSISHDLRAPVRRIEGFAAILLEDYGDKLDDEGIRHLKTIQTHAVHMDSLINGMLTLTRLSQYEIQRQSVNLSDLASSIAAELRQDEPDRRVEIDIDSALTANADPALARDVLENLIGNAWKFTRGRPLAQIAFCSQILNGQLVFLVRDNGAGFDMSLADKLFLPFQRLHSKDEFPGIGIGLATVQRIVQRHGGRIWAEGEPGRGATFYFTLGAQGNPPQP